MSDSQDDPGISIRLERNECTGNIYCSFYGKEGKRKAYYNVTVDYLKLIGDLQNTRRKALAYLKAKHYMNLHQETANYYDAQHEWAIAECNLATSLGILTCEKCGELLFERKKCFTCGTIGKEAPTA